MNNDGSGNLSGYAWSENSGWINFNPSDSQVTFDSTTGSFGGYAWSENSGWIYFASLWPSIPTLSEWAMLIFIVLLLLSGIYKAARHRNHNSVWKTELDGFQRKAAQKG